jgi:osmoprotectant transport system permease protein
MLIALTFFDDLLHAWERNQDTFWPKTLLFLSLTLRGLGLGLLAGIPVGIALTRLRRIASPVIAVLAVLQTVPSLVLLGLLIPFLHIGQTPALFAAVVYSLFPIVMNTYVGITQVSPVIRDAARGMGMTSGQILWHVELPLSFPVLLAGVRTGAIYASAMIVIGTFIGAGGLGDYIATGMSRGDSGLIWLGALPVLALTVFLFWGLGGLAWLSAKNSSLGMSLGGGLIVVLSAYAVYGVAEHALQTRPADVVEAGNLPPGQPLVLVGAKDFTEGQILAEIIKQAIEAKTDLKVEIKSNLGTSMILNALKNGALDLYPEYTGNLLTSKEALDMPVPADKSTITDLVRKEMKRRFGLILLDAFGLNNTYAPCVTQETARNYRLKRISDLQRVPSLRVVVDLSFLDRPDGWACMVKKYQLRFAEPPRQVSPDLRYKALEQGAADVVIGFATDWQIQALKLVVLEDDRGYFPSYHAAPLVRAATLERHPEIAAALKRLAGRIDDRAMRRLNYQVAVEKRSEVEVAREFLAGLD